MTNEDERCAEAKRLRAIDDAFRRGDLEALRQAVNDAASIPNGDLGPGIGHCLVYAIYWSPLPFIRTLLDHGADPNAHVDDGFPPLVAALTTSRSERGAPARPDVDEIVRLLLARGADPNQRGVNDRTALHVAVAERNLLAVHRLLEAGADPDLRTRIDDCDTALEMATASGQTAMAADLARRGAPLGERLRAGLVLLVDVPGGGTPVRRQHRYRIRLRCWLHRGEPIRWRQPWGPVGAARLEDDGETLVTEVRVDRHTLVNGLFYTVDGMRVGGTRRVEIAPHLAFGDRGVPGVVPERALIVAEITVLDAI